MGSGRLLFFSQEPFFWAGKDDYNSIRGVQFSPTWKKSRASMGSPGEQVPTGMKLCGGKFSAGEGQVYRSCRGWSWEGRGRAERGS